MVAERETWFLVGSWTRSSSPPLQFRMEFEQIHGLLEGLLEMFNNYTWTDYTLITNLMH